MSPRLCRRPSVSEPGTPPPPSPDARAGLLRKYRLLCLWRRGKDRSFETDASDADPSASNDGLADRSAMRALAEEFPGALRELDLLGLPELERRVTVLAHADADEPWIDWILCYHALMRAALARKLAAAREPGRNGAGGETRTLGGKLSVAVLQDVARRFSVPAPQVAATLFPSRRGRSSLAAPPRM
jgi:hypothetical protein